MKRAKRACEKRDCNITVGKAYRSSRGIEIVTAVSEPVYTDQGQQPWRQEYETRFATYEEQQAIKRGQSLRDLEEQRKTQQALAADDFRYHQ